MTYAVLMMWKERQRYLPGIVAVAFSALLIALQCGRVLGMFSIPSTPIDHTRANVWLGAPGVLSVDMGQPIPERYLARLARLPEVKDVEIYLQGYAYWSKPTGGLELCTIIGSRLNSEALGAMAELTLEMRQRLSEPDTIVIDESAMVGLGIQEVGDTVEITCRRVRVVGLMKGVPGLATPFVLCSITTARPLLRLAPDQTSYLLASCYRPEDSMRVVEKLQGYSDQKVICSADFSTLSRVYWLTKTKAGIALSFSALLGLAVGAIVVRQTLYAATRASFREFAVLRALGIPAWRIRGLVIIQSLVMAAAGVVFALPIVVSMALVADIRDVKVLLPWWLLTGTVGVTVTMAVLSGLTALGAMRHFEPISLLRV
jgi:putative ABC transport system permease protein